MLWVDAAGYVLDALDGLLRHFAPMDGGRPDQLALSAVRDPNGNTIELGYERGLLAHVVDSAGRRVVLRRDAQARIAAILVKNAEARGRWLSLVSYTYDERGDLRAVTDADGFATRFAYDDHRLIVHEMASGLAFHYRYRADGRCLETWGDCPGALDQGLADDVPSVLADGVTRAKGVHHVKLDFDNDGYVEVADSVQVHRYVMNAAGLADKTVSAGGVTTRTYDAFGYLTSVTDPMGGVTRYKRDYRGRVLEETDPLGRVRTYTRDAHGLVTEITEPDGSKHSYEYDTSFNLIRRTDTLGRVTLWRHDARGLVTECVHPNGGVTRYGYDAQGSLVEEVQPNGATRQYGRDMLGRVVSIRNGLGAEVRCIYTDAGRKVAIHDADGTVVRFTYDGARRLTQVVNPDGNVVKYEYGGLDRLVATHLPTGEILRYLYNREGWLVEVRNEAGGRYRFKYALGGLLTGQRAFDDRTLRYTRDLMGRVTAFDDAAGDRTELEYDAAGQLVKKTLPDGSAEVFEYDLLGRPIRMESAAGVFTLGRDAMGNVVREVQEVDGVAISIDHTYDPLDRRVAIASSLDYREDIERDASGRRLAERLDRTHRIEHALDAAGEEVSRIFDAGGRLDLAFDLVGRLTGLRVASPAVPTMGARDGEPAWLGDRGGASLERKYEWAPGDDLVSVSDPLRRTSESYEWDRRHRLLSRTVGGAQVDASRYDAAGNRHEMLGRRVYGPGNRLLEKDGTRYAYDEAGRLVEKRVGRPDGSEAVWTYDWTADGMLRAVHRPDRVTLEFAYDPIGRRVRKRELRKDPGDQPVLLGTTRFFWDGDRLVHEVRERAAVAGDPIVEERTYCYPDDRLTPWAQRVVEKHGGATVRSEWHYYVADQAGAPVALVDASGQVACELSRTPWGAMEPLAGHVADTPFRLQGQYADADVGLAYNRHRYYDPEAGRFISPDPIGLSGGNLDVFAYGQNAITDVDPFGLHTATAQLDGVQVPNSQIPGTNTFNSGGWGQNPNNQDSYLHDMRDGGAGFGSLYRESHSEFKIMRELAPPDGQTANPNLRGRTLRIDGQSRSCPNCAAELERFAERNQMRVEYHSPGANPPLVCDFRPPSMGGTGANNRVSYSQATAASY